MPHPAPEYISFTAGGGYSYRIPSGYNGLKNINTGVFVIDAELYASRNVPLFSKLKWQSAAKFNLYEETATAGSQPPSEYSGFIELRMPFTTFFLSRNTSWFVQYKKRSDTFSGKFSSDTYYKNGVIFQPGDNVTLNKQLQKIAVAIDTPITGEDSPDSYSRFGIYYAQNIRSRSAKRLGNTNTGGWLLTVLEQHGGLFYDINKPVFTPGLSLSFSLDAGLGQQEILPNVYEITSSEFKASKTLFYTDFNAGIAYRISITKWLGVKTYIEYGYSDIALMSSISDSSSTLNNNGEQSLLGGLLFSFIL
ncbi:MAG: hypothetical protein LBH05_00255 [Deferribacteraceae bacterium]|nr:hypothetical protein [Deferribacteraceae bacterium]